MTEFSLADFYHPSQAAANEARRAMLEMHSDRIAEIRVQFEPCNGYVLCVVPRPMDLSDLFDVAEVLHPSSGRRISPPRKNKLRIGEEEPLLGKEEMESAVETALKGWTF